MQTCEKAKTLFVGVDVHKDTHTAVGLSPFGEKLFELTVGNYPQNFEELAGKVRLVAKVANLSPRIGLEDCQGFGQRLTSYLNEAGHSVVHVAPILVDHKRKKAAHPAKKLGISRPTYIQLVYKPGSSAPWQSPHKPKTSVCAASWASAYSAPLNTS